MWPVLLTWFLLLAFSKEAEGGQGESNTLVTGVLCFYTLSLASVSEPPEIMQLNLSSSWPSADWLIVVCVSPDNIQGDWPLASYGQTQPCRLMLRVGSRQTKHCVPKQ